MDERYRDIMNNIWNIPISPLDKCLYLYLVHSCYEMNWREPFGHSDKHLADVLGVSSVNTIRQSKIRLKENKMIDFVAPDVKSKGPNGQTKFWLTISKNDTVEAPTISKFDIVDTGTISKNDTDDTSTVSKNDMVRKKDILVTISKNDTVGDENETTISKNDTVEAPTISKFDNNNSINTYTHYPITSTNDEEAAASSGLQEQRPKKEKKIREKISSGRAEKNPLFQKCMEIYDAWFKERNDGIGPKIDGAAGNALNSIIRHLQTQVRQKNEYNGRHQPEQYIGNMTDDILADRVIESWSLIFNNWHLMDNWLQGKTRLIDINSQFNNITTAIRNGIVANKKNGNGGQHTTNTGITKGKGASIAQLQSLKHNTNGNPV